VRTLDQRRPPQLARSVPRDVRKHMADRCHGAVMPRNFVGKTEFESYRACLLSVSSATVGKYTCEVVTPHSCLAPAGRVMALYRYMVV
jgi:hypothetical protein